MRWLTLILAVAQVIAPNLPFLGFGARIGSGFTSPVVPAPYAFVIWLPIFALTLAYAVWQLRTDNPLVPRLGVWPAAAFALCTLWSLVAITCPAAIAVQVSVFVALLAALAVIAVRLNDWRNTPLPAVAVPAWGLFAGWATVAVFANMSAVIPLGRLGWTGLTAAGQSIAILFAAALVAAALTIRLRGCFWYAGAVIWGLAGVAVADTGGVNRAVGWIATGLAVTLGVLTMITRRRPYRMANRPD